MTPDSHGARLPAWVSAVRRRTVVVAVGAGVVLLGAVAITVAGAVSGGPSVPGGGTIAPQSNTLGGSSTGVVPRPSASPTASFLAPTPAELDALPEARYDAVIAGLIPSTVAAMPASVTAYQLTADTPIYGASRGTAVARFAGANFLGEPTVVVPVSTLDGWAQVMTPARQALPSSAPGAAPAQTVGWVRMSALTNPVSLTSRVVVSVSAQTLTIVDADPTKNRVFTVAVGAAATPTPTGVTGYIQARYLDPKQNQTKYPIQLTSMHSTAADEPYGGQDGGLIGLHYEPRNTGDISHGCIRLSADAVTAVNLLPLGTIVQLIA